MKINNRQQLLLVLTVVACGLFVGDKLIFSPLTSLWKTRAKNVAELRKKVKDGTNLIRREQSIRSTWEHMRLNTLPNNQSLAEEQVLKAITAWSDENRVPIASYSSNWKHDADEYTTLDCHVDASGSLDQLSRFLYDIEKGPMGLRLESVELSAHDTTGQQLTLSLQISGLVLNSQRK
jgi:hypothetical protein